MKKIFFTTATLFSSLFLVFAAPSLSSLTGSASASSTTYFSSVSTSDSTYTSTDNIKKAQIAMATNEYIVTAGDIYTLAYSGGSMNVSVDNSYRVRIANLGIINAKGLTLQEFKTRVESLIVNNYPRSDVQFFLANPAQFHVFVKGEVISARTVETWALERTSSVLAKLYTEHSSARFFTIISEDGAEKKYDLFKSVRDGDFAQDPYLRPGDTIVVPKIERKVEIKGAVYRPGIYELLPDEELNSLIFKYGDGFTHFALKTRIELSRFTGNANFYDTVYYKETDLIRDIPLANYDKVYVPSLENIQPTLFVEGAVNTLYDADSGTLLTLESDEKDDATDATPGLVVSEPQPTAKLRFKYAEGKSFVQFILENSQMFINSSDLANSYVARKNPETGENQIIPTNINAILYPSKNAKDFEDFTLVENDKIIVPYTQYYVTVTGGVNAEGKYAYQPGKKWNYYVNLANGFNLDQNLFRAVKITDKDGKKISKNSEIPPEALIYASRNSPKDGWLIPLITSILTFISTCLSVYGAIVAFGK